MRLSAASTSTAADSSRKSRSGHRIGNAGAGFISGNARTMARSSQWEIDRFPGFAAAEFITASSFG
jgi:hypothetical protein